MRAVFKYTGLLGLAVMTGCSPESVDSAFIPMPPLRLNVPPFPLQLSDSHQTGFDRVPELTAKRFLIAHVGLAKYGPVTKEAVRGHARFHAAAQSGQLLRHLFTYDLNGDLEISREEIQKFAHIPLHEILDGNRDNAISLIEVMHYSRGRYTQRGSGNARPVESYLMLFDINVDGMVTRTEMQVALKPYLADADVELTGDDRALP